nr:MAG TPA: hypothetical protein [Bacteriophage sp.]DAJ07014.1 MAG TPA: hypothetical protein [Caudoviricetes sp.]DAQ90510.1 MAG TPA: hypothetical protein [Caudoviricetes sp.]
MFKRSSYCLLQSCNLSSFTFSLIRYISERVVNSPHTFI